MLWHKCIIIIEKAKLSVGKRRVTLGESAVLHFESVDWNDLEYFLLWNCTDVAVTRERED